MHGVRKPLDEARLEANALPLEDIDVSRPELFRSNTIWPYFERLRREDPVHYCAEPRRPVLVGDQVQGHHAGGDQSPDFFLGSNIGGIGIQDQARKFRREMFIAMDPPKHDAQRKAVNPIVPPENLRSSKDHPRARRRDSRPSAIGETFDWVDTVSIELTTQMLATLFDFPWEDRRKLTRWSDVATAAPGSGIIDPKSRAAPN